MNKLFAGIALAALVGAPALAADLPARPAPVPYKAPPPAVVYYSWTGCFVGGFGGGLWARKDWTETTTGAAIGSHDADSWIAGVQAGCDYQFAGGLVIGIQGDYGWTDAKGSNTDLIVPTWTDRSNIRSLASVTGRIGYAWDRFLGYVRGGGAWERDNYDVYETATGASIRTASETRRGWTIGVGGEYAFTNFLTGFIEYDYYDFGTRTNTFGNAAQADIKERKSVLKAGLNLRWGPGPVVAKY
jgi:outer membrane immunogenic protein